MLWSSGAIPAIVVIATSLLSGRWLTSKCRITAIVRFVLIKAFIQQKLPKVPLEGGDDFGSVASGLARYAERLFAD